MRPIESRQLCITKTNLREVALAIMNLNAPRIPQRATLTDALLLKPGVRRKGPTISCGVFSPQPGDERGVDLIFEVQHLIDRRRIYLSDDYEIDIQNEEIIAVDSLNLLEDEVRRVHSRNPQKRLMKEGAAMYMAEFGLYSHISPAERIRFASQRLIEESTSS